VESLTRRLWSCPRTDGILHANDEHSASNMAGQLPGSRAPDDEQTGNIPKVGVATVRTKPT